MRCSEGLHKHEETKRKENPAKEGKFDFAQDWMFCDFAALKVVVFPHFLHSFSVHADAKAER